MFIYDVLQKDKVYQSVASELRALGIKYRPKKAQTSTSAKSETKSSGFSKDQNIQNSNRSNPTKVFKTSLANQPVEVVNLSEGAIVYVPKFVSEAATFLLQNITQEGLFRKVGSNARIRELMNRVDNGASLGDKYNPADVASCFKAFFRFLPEPLIPFCMQDLFVRCGLLKSGREEALLMACLLLPVHHLNTLAFLMEFLKTVAKYEKENKMSIDNLAKVFGPNIMPVQETTMVALQPRLEAHLAIVKTLIENAEKIGILPEQIAENMTAESTGSTDINLHGSDLYLHKYKKKKHRSGSLTRKPHLSASNLNLRMFSGLKKIVGKNNLPAESEASNNMESPDPYLNTSSNKSTKKRKVDSSNEALDVKKSTVRDRSPFSKLKGTKSVIKTNLETRSTEKIDKNKKMRLSLEKLVQKGKNKIINKHDTEKYKAFESPCIDRRWSSVSNSCTSPRKASINREDSLSLGSLLQDGESKTRIQQIYDEDVFMNADVNLSDDNESLSNDINNKESNRIKRLRLSAKRRSLNTLLTERAKIKNASKHKLEVSPELSYNREIKRTKSIDSVLPNYRQINEDEPEYVRVRKSEYEDIKNRVMAIETRISQEFNHIIHDSDRMAVDLADNVQNKYVKTLEEANIENTLSADHLAKQISKELKIRRSTEQKIFRSPSARKIGSIRRRSQEKIPRGKVNRTATWNSSERANSPTTLTATPVNVHSYSPTDIVSNPSIAETSKMSSCSDETNARLEYLQEQLQTLINQTVEHTRMPLSDDSPVTPRTTPAKSPKNNMYRTPVTTKYFNQKMSELKRSQKQSESAKRNYDSENWRDANKYFSVDGTHCSPVPQTGRASVAKLRTQNAGMVLAKAKLFDSSQEPNSARRFARNQDKTGVVSTPPVPPPRHKRKTYSPKGASGRNRSFVESNRQSPKRLSVHQKENEATPEPDNCKTPHIKKPLMVRTPRSAKIVRRQAVEIKRTPMKAVPIVTPKRSPAVRSRYQRQQT